MKYVLMDAFAQHTLYPDSFGLPSSEDLESLKAGSQVKICVDSVDGEVWNNTLMDEVETKEYSATGERFWVTITSIEGNKINGVIDNDLLFTKWHGLKFPDAISFETKNILEVWK